MYAALAGIPVVVLLTGLGLRVVARARAARAPTDALIGVYFVCMGIGGIPALLANEPDVFGAEAAPFAMAFGHATLSVGFAALHTFVWRCFGAHSRWRMTIAITACVALALLYVTQGVVERFEPPGGAVVRATALVRTSALVWALAESLRYWLMMRRRVPLGLAQPLVANRFLLWCLWMGGMLGTSAIAVVVRFAFPGYGPDTSAATRVMVVVPFLALCLVAAASLWLAFFPPTWFARRFADDAAPRSA